MEFSMSRDPICCSYLETVSVRVRSDDAVEKRGVVVSFEGVVMWATKSGSFSSCVKSWDEMEPH